ncbi:hypothetical protein RclHR1_02700006 [Rhizophagus clarus]|uniref:Uncharacterized protein n=1 Tax=Rhizophagus clarus TaxID=94130 RepID=A0A2Z6RE11_9GLOM|nr:hypothetical protein RclHR1_02700006 [Rhizophagus clarus]
MTKSNKVLTPEYLDWHAKLSGLPSILINKIRFKLYETYKKETGNDPWQLPKAVINILAKPQTSDFKPITFEVRLDSELIIKSVLEHFPYLKFQNSFRRFNNYNFASLHSWSSPCPISMENMGIMDYMNKLEYCLTCNSSNNKLKFAIVV